MHKRGLWLARLLASATLCAVGIGCGVFDDNGSSSLAVEPLGSQFTLACVSPNGSGGVSVHATGDGGFALVIAEADGATDQSLVLHRFDTATETFAAPKRVLGPSADAFLGVHSCMSGDGSLVISWQSGRDLSNVFAGKFLDILDTHFVRVSGDAPAPEAVVQANVNTVGRQANSHLSCLRDGGVALTWQSRCTAVERIGIAWVSFRPDECDSEPPEGLYLGRFGRDGLATESAQLVSPAGGSRVPREAAIAAISDGRFVVVAGKQVQVYGRDGLLQDTRSLLLGGQRDDPELFCLGDISCVVKVGAGAEIIDLGTPADTLTLTLKANSSEALPDGTTAQIVATRPDMACDDSGLCIGTWRLERDTQIYDVFETASLGVFARGFDARSRRLGEEFALTDFDGAQDIEVWPIGSNTFVVAAALNGQTIIQRLRLR